MMLESCRHFAQESLTMFPRLACTRDLKTVSAVIAEKVLVATSTLICNKKELRLAKRAC